MDVDELTLYSDERTLVSLTRWLPRKCNIMLHKLHIFFTHIIIKNEAQLSHERVILEHAVTCNCLR